MENIVETCHLCGFLHWSTENAQGNGNFESRNKGDTFYV